MTKNAVDPRGYFALWRKFQDHEFWQESRVFSKAEAWIDILWNAQWKREPQEVLIGMTLLMQNYGECLKSMQTWSARWGWGKAKVQRFLNLLKNMNQINLVNERVTTRIIVTNYEHYDPRQQESESAPIRAKSLFQKTESNSVSESIRKADGLNLADKGFTDTSDTQMRRERNANETRAKRESTTNKKVYKDKNVKKVYIPQDFTLTEELKKYAIDRAVDPDKIDELKDSFVGYHVNKGSKLVDWGRAWQAWVRNAPEYSKWAMLKNKPKLMSDKTKANLLVLKGKG